MNAILKYRRPALWWALFIFILCTIKLGGVSQSPLFFAGFDKLTHCGLWFVLTTLLCSGQIRKNNRHNLTTMQSFCCLLIPLLYGGTIELLQAYVFTWRSGEWADLFADCVGTGMGLFGALIAIWSAHYEKK
ncbi:VanZ family protein [uncultured Mucilaginibacter sp.]|uniref:VanZ family protein n=1 Tax=uncultured Mucilaginibacter sp. TaxID=797541 RepID=UPI0025F5D1A0|nr:VanZ family protein [uncultured Mucilaginibacter sp.]